MYSSSGASGGMVNSIGLSMGASHWNNLDNVSSITFPSLYDTLGFASNVFAVLNGIKVAKYLTHIHGNPPSVKWFMSNLYKTDKISLGFGYIVAIVDGINVWRETGDVAKGIYTGLYDVGSMIISSSLGGLIGSIAGTLLGGPAGAIIGTIAGVAIEAGIQYFKENVVNWLDKSFDDFIKWISSGWSELVNA